MYLNEDISEWGEINRERMTMCDDSSYVTWYHFDKWILILGIIVIWNHAMMTPLVLLYINICSNHQNVFYYDCTSYWCDMSIFHILNCTMWSILWIFHHHNTHKCSNDVYMIQITWNMFSGVFGTFSDILEWIHEVSIF